MRKYVNRRSLFIFGLAFACLCGACFSFLSYSYSARLGRDRAYYDARLREDAARLTDYVEASLDSALSSCRAIFASKWYRHYRNVAGIYAREFDALKRIEIQEELGAKVAALPFIEDILLVTPHLDAVISKNSWFHIEQYLTFYKKVAIELPADVRQYARLSSADPLYAVLEVQDTTARREKTIAGMLVSKKAFAAAVSTIAPASVTFLKIELGSDEMCVSGDQAPDAILLTSKTRVADCTLTMGFDSFERALGRAARREFALTLLLAVLASLLLAVLVALVTNKPIAEMILSFGGQAKDLDNPYQFIYEYVDAYSKHMDSLKLRADRLDDARSRYLTLMRNEIFIGMLTNPDFQYGDEYIVRFMPWIQGGDPFLLVAAESARPSRPAALSEDLWPRAVRQAAICDIFRAQCAFLWFGGAREAEEARGALIERLSAERRLLFAVSDVLHEPEDMRAAWAGLRAELDCARRAQLELPFAAQLMLTEALRKKNLCAALEVMEGSPEGTLYPLMHFLARHAMEAGIDPEDFERAFDEAEDEIARRAALADMLHALIAPAPARELDEVGARIAAYIGGNFTDPDLSVTLLSDRFQMHRTLVSRAVKAATGETFSCHLQMLRMNRAVELLANTDAPLSAIAEQVGYLNYLSFKRAFQRCYGRSPREWREQREQRMG